MCDEPSISNEMMIENALLEGMTIRKSVLTKNRLKSLQKMDPILSQDREFVRNRSNYFNQSCEGGTRYKGAATGTMRNQGDA